MKRNTTIYERNTQERWEQSPTPNRERCRNRDPLSNIAHRTALGLLAIRPRISSVHQPNATQEEKDLPNATGGLISCNLVTKNSRFAYFEGTYPTYCCNIVAPSHRRGGQARALVLPAGSICARGITSWGNDLQQRPIFTR